MFNLDHLRKLENGWYDHDQGFAFNKEGVGWLENNLNKYSFYNLQFLAFPTLDENMVQLENNRLKIEILIDIDPDHNAEMTIFDKDYSSDVTTGINLNEEEGWLFVLDEIKKQKEKFFGEEKILF